MRATILPLVLAAAGACAPPSVTTATSGATAGAPTVLESRIRARVADVAGARVAVSYVDLGSADTVHLLADSAFHAASTMKVPVLVELVRRSEAGDLPLDTAIVLRDTFASIVDGSPYRLSAGDDSDSLLYRRVGERVTLRELAERMIVRSSNLATNALIEVLGAGQIQRTTDALGAPGMRVLRGVEDGRAYERGMNNTTTARALATLMRAIEEGRAASPAGTAEIRRILLAQEFDSEIPAGLPPGTPVAHKTGWITATTHDAAIVYPPGRPPFVLVVLTGSIPERAVAQRLMADVARMAWEHHAARHAR